MPNCWTIDPLVTPYVDGELAAADRDVVERHLRACPPCRARVISEQAVRDLVSARKPTLQSACAPPALRARCQEQGSRQKLPAATSRSVMPGIRYLRPLALAAALVLIVGAAFIYPLTANSSRVLAAELAVDHMKCFMLNGALGTHHTTDAVESELASSFGWATNLPDRPQQAGLELVVERTCLYGEGRVAHVMYRQNGRPVSIFMLPDDVRAEQTLSVLGHRAAIWSIGGRTFVLVSRGPIEEVERAAAFVQASLR
jgi:anti-sigma factor RsiW